MKNISKCPIAKLLLFCMILSGMGCAFQGATQTSPDWRQMFNGKDLNDWQVKIRGHDLNENFGNTFRVEDGNIQVRYDGYQNKFEDKFGHLFYKKPFSSYLIAVEYRFVGNQVKDGAAWAHRNSGIMIHGQQAATMDKNQDFPNSIEVQLLGGDGTGERPTANLCTPGTKFVKDGKVIETHCANSTSRTFHDKEWVRVEVLVLADSLIVHYANGEEVMRYEKPQTDNGELIKGGTISLQSESHPIDFRKVEIVDLEQYENDPEELKKVVEKLTQEKRVARR